jgi:Domain of Unknown Function (DUF748)
MLRLPRSRGVRALLGVELCIGIYALLGFQLLPRVLRSQATSYVQEHYGRKLSMGKVRFDPFALQLEIEQLSVPDADGSTLLRWRKLVVDFEPTASLWRRAWVFRDITLEQPQLCARVREDGQLNLSDFASHEPASDEPPPALAIDAFTMDAGALEFSDHSRGEPFSQRLRPISFQLRHFRTSKEGGAFSLSASGDEGARFWWKGEFALAPALVSRGRIAIRDMQLASLSEYLTAASPVALREGRGNFSLSYRVALGPTLTASASLHDAALRGLRLQSRTHADDALTVPELKLHEARVEYPARTVHIEAVQISEAHTRAVIDGQGALNLARMAGPGEGGSSNGSPSTWKLELARLDLVHASASLEDHSVEPALRVSLESLDVGLRALTLDPSLAIPFTVAASFGRDGALRASGTLTPASTDAEVDLELAALRLALAQPYLRPFAAIVVDEGTLSLQGHVSRKQGTSFQGGLTVRDLRTRDRDGAHELVSVPELALRELRYSEHPASLRISKVTLHKPSARVVLSAAQTLNLTEVLVPRPASEVSTEPLAVRVNELAIEDMQLSFTDYFIQPNFALDLRGVRGSVKGISSDPNARARLALRGTLGASAPVQIEGQLLPFAYDANTDIEISWQNVPLPVFNPYSGRFAGYNIVKGDLASTLQYRVRRGALDAKHHVRLDQLTWGEATDTKQSATLPVRLATALLRDRNGVITLDVPVQGSLNDPKFAVWPLVKQALINVAVRAVTAPFDFLGSLFAGAEKARYVRFRPGESALEDSDRKQLSALASALAERPSLVLDVPLGVDRTLDREALVERKFQRALEDSVRRELWGDSKHAAYRSLEDDDRIDVLEPLYERLTGKEPELPEPPDAPEGTGFRERRRLRDAFRANTLEQMTRGAIRVDQGELDALGLGRANAIERALTEGGKIDRHRVLVSNEGQVRAEQGKVLFELVFK